MMAARGRQKKGSEVANYCEAHIAAAACSGHALETHRYLQVGELVDWTSPNGKTAGDHPAIVYDDALLYGAPWSRVCARDAVFEGIAHMMQTKDMTQMHTSRQCRAHVSMFFT